jgi:Fe-S cluster assembly scaffold protein SufB
MTMSAPLPAPVKPVHSTLPTDRYWKLDYTKLDFGNAAATVELELTIDEATRAHGVILCTLAEARLSHASLLARALNSSIADDESRFTQAAADSGQGFFCYVPEGVQIKDGLALGITGTWSGRGVVLVGPHASLTLTESLGTAVADSVVFGMVEIVLDEHAKCDYVVLQHCAESTRSFFTRRANVAANATMRFSTAELGATISQSRVDAMLLAPGAHAELSTVAFATHDHYLDLADDLDHTAPDTTSNTMIKAAAIDQGRGRYYGMIRILPRAHGSDAVLRDDTLLLSPEAHIDSVPALEIAANDVKAFHGATVSNVDAEQRFYAMSRGFSISEADRMITLGFFEPAIARFPNEVAREFIRTQLAARIGD